MPTLQDIKRIGEFKVNTAHLNVMCDKIDRTPHKVYEIIVEYGSFVDSYTRETIFQYLADKYHDGDYDNLYNRWINGNRFLEAYNNGSITKQEFNKLMGE